MIRISTFKIFDQEDNQDQEVAPHIHIPLSKNQYQRAMYGNTEMNPYDVALNNKTYAELKDADDKEMDAAGYNKHDRLNEVCILAKRLEDEISAASVDFSFTESEKIKIAHAVMIRYWGIPVMPFQDYCIMKAERNYLK